MRGRPWGGRGERGFAPSALACLVLGASACIQQEGYSAPAVEAGAGGGVGGAISQVGSAGGGAAGAPNLLAAAGSVVAGACSAPPLSGPELFDDQAFWKLQVARRELFSWTTDEQVAELRRDQVLFTRAERPGMGPGYAFEFLKQLAQDQNYPERAQLASVLGGELFEKARFAWSEPWATRMGWPGEDYGGNLLRIVLKPEAWVVLVKAGNLTVYDMQNQGVPVADVLANPTRVGALLYEKDAEAGGPVCNQSFVAGSNGYREFIVGNLAMVEEWSLGTQQIRDRLSENIARLSTFLQRIRACPGPGTGQSWNFSVVCGWDFPQANVTEISAYESSLAIPSDNYRPVPERLAAMIETLRGDLFEPDPLVVKPGSP